MDVLGTADAIAPAIDIIRRNNPDILLLGWSPSAPNSQRLFATIIEAKLATRVIVLTNGGVKEDHVEAVRQGCCGMVPRQTSTELLLKSIRKVYAAEFCLARLTTAEVTRRPAGGPQPSRRTLAQGTCLLELRRTRAAAQQ